MGEVVGMKLINKATGEQHYCIYWNGKNKVEYRQFGVTGTKEGKQTKINCRGEAFVKRAKVFVPILPCTYVVIEEGTNYVPYTAEELYKKYREPEK